MIVKDRARKHMESPEDKAHMEEMAKKEAEKKAQRMADDLMIKGKKLDVQGHKRCFAEFFDPNGVGERWGLIMQEEMKKQGLTHLTPDLVKSTFSRADSTPGLSGGAYGGVLWGLTHLWKYGEELALIEGVDIDRVKIGRVLKSDKAVEFCEKYKPGKYCSPNNINYKEKEAAGIIAELLGDEKLIDAMFLVLGSEGEKGKFDGEHLKELIPVIDLPDNRLSTLYAVCKGAKNKIRGVKERSNSKLVNYIKSRKMLRKGQ
jgi:hypothetical protein